MLICIIVSLGLFFFIRYKRKARKRREHQDVAPVSAAIGTAGESAAGLPHAVPSSEPGSIDEASSYPGMATPSGASSPDGVSASSGPLGTTPASAPGAIGADDRKVTGGQGG